MEDNDFSEIYDEASNLVFDLMLKNKHIPAVVWATIFWTIIASGNASRRRPWKDFKANILESLIHTKENYISAVNELNERDNKK